MHVGRTVSGLPTDQAEFAMLPPYFSRETDEEGAIVHHAIEVCFTGFPMHLLSAVMYSLASVVYHRNYLE